MSPLLLIFPLLCWGYKYFFLLFCRSRNNVPLMENYQPKSAIYFREFLAIIIKFGVNSLPIITISNMLWWLQMKIQEWLTKICSSSIFTPIPNTNLVKWKYILDANNCVRYALPMSIQIIEVSMPLTDQITRTKIPEIALKIKFILDVKLIAIKTPAN